MADSWHGMSHHGVVEMNRDGFVEVIELDPSSSSLVSMHLSAIRKLSYKTSEQNGDYLILVHVRSYSCI